MAPERRRRVRFVRVLLGAFGTRGDVQGGVVLAKTLVARGHRVSLFVSPCSLALARAQGIEASPAGADFEEISVRAGRGTLREMIGLLALGRRDIGVQLAALEGPAREADVVVGSSVCLVGSILSESLAKPYAFVSPVPQVFESDAYPSGGIPFQRLPPWLNRLSFRFNDFVFDRMLLGALNELRVSRRLPPARSCVRSWIGRHPILAADEALARAPADHRPPITQVGAMLLDDASELSAATRAFLETGTAPVYIGFGSMPDPDPARTTRTLLEAVRRAGVRAIISRGWAKLGGGTAPEGVLFIGAEPHRQLFPRCAAIVHHGGAGTTHAAALAGVPQVVMPYLLDQHFWAHRAWVVGVSAGSMRRHGRNPEPLARAIRRCLEDEALRARARALVPRIATDGAVRAAALIEEFHARKEAP
jgi:UDP:flavonoid glycosyltransferase YjiC (YdhE family)